MAKLNRVTDGEKEATLTTVGGKHGIDVNILDISIDENDKITTQAKALALQVDAVSDSLMYIGEAAPGVATATAAWRIKKMTITGTVTAIAWADGNGNFDNIWDNRAALTYA